MTLHRPTPDLLLDAAAGNTAAEIEILVRAHAEISAESREDMALLEEAHFALADELPSVMPPDWMLARLMDAIDGELGPSPAVPIPDDELPEALRTFVGGGYDEIQWEEWLPGVRRCGLQQLTKGVVSFLVELAPGAALPPHGHTHPEYVFVVHGAYTDEYGHFQRGDVAINDKREIHNVIATPDDVCVSLIVQDFR